MFAYCNNNPIMHRDESGCWPTLIDVFAAITTAVSVAATVVACVALVPALITTGGTAAVATTIATVSGTIAVAAGTTAVIAKKTTQKEKSYTVYTLSDPSTKEVVYVGRTSDYKKRMQAHSLNLARRDLEPNVLHEGMSYYQARAAEQLYILFYGTLDKTNKSKNQINGVNPHRKDYLTIMHHGFGFSEALDSLLTNDILCLFE